MASCSHTKQNFLSVWRDFYQSISDKLVKKFDVIVALVHCLLVRDIHFRCVGNGEDKLLVEGEMESEDLPDGWNEDLYRYAIRYVYDNRLYILFGHKSNDCIVLNILNVSTRKVSNILLSPDDLMDIASIHSVLERMRQELVEPIIIHPKVHATTQTDPPTNVRRLANLSRGVPSSMRGAYRDIDQLRGTRGPLSLYRFNSITTNSAANRFHPHIIQEHVRRLQALRSRMAATYGELPLSQLNNVNSSNRNASVVRNNNDLEPEAAIEENHSQRRRPEQNWAENNDNELQEQIRRLHSLRRMFSSPNIGIDEPNENVSNMSNPSNNNDIVSASNNGIAAVNIDEDNVSSFHRSVSEPGILGGNENNGID
ncbi:uncharacterized protein LOC119685332 isoform X2 [Teleopsis dalmanni]|uniref:uncharacterized protein LOC119685332 isoform X2 n=1 Tax=Teleopsis dalmanni TaxID=139649 RepID=UPI0018CD9808|nr:uncharacterized protein LOC119685332 isoform X2 [Teleopsis dalmanni]